MSIKKTTQSDHTADNDKNLRVPPEEPYLANNNLDYLARINMELLSELWIMRDRIAVLEELLIEKETLARGEIDNFVPSATFSERIELLRKMVVDNVIGAPFKHQCTVESLLSEGKKLAELHSNKD